MRNALERKQKRRPFTLVFTVDGADAGRVKRQTPTDERAQRGRHMRRYQAVMHPKWRGMLA